MPLARGDKLGPYEILELIAKGGMGEVYKASDPRLGRAVAIKISAEQFSTRFEREAYAIAALNHPHICTLYDVGPNYLVTELIEGETLRDYLKKPPSQERTLDIARQVLEALRAAHRAGIVHRDLKPANIMVRSDGYVKVLDFGLAKRMPTSGLLQTEDTVTNLSVPGQILGTVAYMSPEQILGQEIDQRSDLFAFGIVLCEMLTGQHPWPRESRWIHCTRFFTMTRPRCRPLWPASRISCSARIAKSVIHRLKRFSKILPARRLHKRCPPARSPG